MNYLEYYEVCRKGKDPLADMRTFTHQILPFRFDVSEIRRTCFVNIDQIPAEDWIKKVPYKEEYLQLLMPIFDKLIPYLQDTVYCCPIMIDKVYIYRTVPFGNRTSSALYHYDNTPPTMLKTIVYLNDVMDDSDGPIEFCGDLVKEPSRQGPRHWFAPPNNSRLTEGEVAPYPKVKIYGEAGIPTLFYPSNVHRANPPAEGRVRDVINIVTQPTLNENDRYNYISGHEENGSPLMDPRERRKLRRLSNA